MLKFNDEYEAYILEYDDVIICWDDEPDEDYKEIAEVLRKAYNSNIGHIAECIYQEVKDIFNVKSVDEVISGLGKPQIYPDNEEVIYCDISFDDSHIISFEFSNYDFTEIDNISIDG